MKAVAILERELPVDIEIDKDKEYAQALIDALIELDYDKNLAKINSIRLKYGIKTSEK